MTNKSPDEVYAVPESEQLELDVGEGVDASEDGLDDEDLDEIYDNPGEVIEEDLA